MSRVYALAMPDSPSQASNDSDDSLAELEFASQASQQLLLDLQQAVAESAHTLDMSREKEGKAKATTGTINSEPSSKRRKIGRKDQDLVRSKEASSEKRSSVKSGKKHTRPDKPGDGVTTKTSVSKKDPKGSDNSSLGAQFDQDTKEPKLKRFGSEDPSSPPPTIEQAIENIFTPVAQNEGANDSDSDAPEEAVVGAAQDRIGEAEAKVAKAHAKTQEQRRARRKEHNRRMTDQATTSTKSRLRSPLEDNGSQSSEATDDGLPFGNVGRQSANRTLPVLLPAELLSTEFTPQVPVVSTLQRLRDSKMDKQKLLLDRQNRPPKDRFHGNTRIRVLAEQPSSLPPKSESKGKTLRESWLLGQRGRNEKTWTPRVFDSVGFVRNPKKKKSKKR